MEIKPEAVHFLTNDENEKGYLSRKARVTFFGKVFALAKVKNYFFLFFSARVVIFLITLLG